jgi:hypothetical protein
MEEKLGVDDLPPELLRLSYKPTATIYNSYFRPT